MAAKIIKFYETCIYFTNFYYLCKRITITNPFLYYCNEEEIIVLGLLYLIMYSR